MMRVNLGVNGMNEYLRVYLYMYLYIYKADTLYYILIYVVRMINIMYTLYARVSFFCHNVV